MQLSLNTPLLNLSGIAIEGLKDSLGQIVANQIVAVAKGNVVKIYGWGIKLQANDPLELDDSDKSLFRSVIEDNESMTILVKGQVLSQLDKQAK